VESVDGGLIVGFVNMLAYVDVKSIPDGKELLMSIIETCFLGQSKFRSEILEH
jgi:hypothetical protein